MKRSQFEKAAPLIKKAVDRRARLNACKTLIKRAQEEASAKEVDYVDRRRKLKLILGALLGGFVGATHSNNAGKGALIGAGVGTGLAYGSNKLRDWAGMDPIGKTVTLAKGAPGT